TGPGPAGGRSADEPRAVAGEGLAQAGLSVAEALERVAVHGALVARVLVGPAPHAVADLVGQREAGEGVDPRDLREGIGDELAVVDVEEALLAAGARVEAALHAAGEELAPLAPDLERIDAVAVRGAQHLDQAREGRHALHRIAVRPHHARAREGREQ